MSTEKTDSDPLLAAAETAWLEYVKGTFMQVDKRVFVEGFRRGWQGRKNHSLAQMPQSYTSVTVSCWLCRGEHFAGVKWCPMLMRI